MTTGEKIKAARLRAGLTQKELAEKVGVKFSAIHKYEAGLVVNLKQETIAKLSDALGVKPSYLMGYTDTDVEKAFDVRQPPDVVMLPVIGMASAGKGVIAEEDVIDYEPAAARFSGKEYYYIQVHGDSMSPEINDGDLILVHRQTSVDSGDIGVFLVDGENGYVKRVTYDAENIILKSTNPYYPPMHFVGADVLRVYVVGKVLRSIRRF